MSTGIEWTDETWNPTTGCTKVSPGCDHCYAERITNRFGGPGAFDTVVLHPERLEKPLRWRKPKRVFVDSMSDLFHDDVPDEFIADVWNVMAQASQHQFQILTKRPGRMASLLGRWAWNLRKDPVSDNPPWPLPNVWLGTSVETQKWADVRIPKLLEAPAAIRFLSCEPLLGAIDLSRYLGIERMEALGGWGHEMFAALNNQVGPNGGLHWVIAGGESGPDARPMHPDWARSLRDQCVESGVPFLFKQWGEWAPLTSWMWFEKRRAVAAWVDPDGRWSEAGEALPATGALPIRRVGKHAAGRELDGRTWDEYPAELVSA